LLKCQTLQDPANDKLKQLLLKAVQTSAFIKSNEGQKFIVGLFTLSPAFIKHIQNAIKAVIPGCSRQDAKDYGEIYFKAWNSAGDQLVLTIEEDCIQNFMYHCVLANKKAKIFEPLLVLLGSFHHAKNNKKAQSMVQRLWEPLLWRHLKVANSEVRGNAVQILTEAFPLEDPEAELEVRASSQEAQVKGFHELLKDECPEVRVLAIQGVASILSKYWLIFSSTELKDFMVVIVKYLANDMSSPKVRLAVVKAMTHLVQNCPRSHLYLKQILPKLGEVLFDSNEAVRSSMLDLLSAVKAIKAIPFWSICPLDDLLDRLGKDKKCVAQKIVNLLFNSFFPLEQSEEAKIERCTYLIKHDPEASRRFYLYCEKLLSLHDSVKFMLAILVNLKKHAKYVPDDHGQEEEEDKENVSANRRDSLAAAAGDHLEVTLNTTRKDGTIRLANDTLEASLSDSLVVGGLVDIVCVIWMIRSKELAEKENNEYRSLLEKKSAKILTVLFKQYRSCHVHRSVIYLCSFLPHSSALTISSFCLSRLKCAEITDDVVQKFPSWTENQNLKLNEELIFTTYVDALCNWRRGDDILELILQWLTRGTQFFIPTFSTLKVTFFRMFQI
jgi:condensin-2 complex subunit G2